MKDERGALGRAGAAQLARWSTVQCSAVYILQCGAGGSSSLTYIRPLSVMDDECRWVGMYVLFYGAGEMFGYARGAGVGGVVGDEDGDEVGMGACGSEILGGGEMGLMDMRRLFG